MTLKLKLKYRNPNHRKRAALKGSPDPEGGTYVYSYGINNAARPRTGNSKGPTPKWSKNSVKPPKRVYGPF